MGFGHRLSRLFKRVVLPAAVLAYVLLSVFNLHTRNIYNNQFGQLQPYTGGAFDDIRLIRCYAWNGNCNQLILQGGKSDPSNNGQEEVVWHRVAKSLDINGEKPSSWKTYHEFLYVHLADQESFGSPTKAIIDIAFGDPGSNEPPTYVVKDSQSSTGRPRSRLDITNNYDNWEQKENGIWVKIGKTSSEGTITDLMYLFGEDVVEPREFWSLASGKLHLRSPHPISLTLHRGEAQHPSTPSLKESSKNEFKILQLSDLHFSSDYGFCKDQMTKDPNCKADVKTLGFVHHVLDLESPDLVVITGDLIDGTSTFDYQTGILKALSPLITRSIPYAIALGEYDKSEYASRLEIINFITSLPYSMMQSSKESIDDITNYVLEIKDKEDNTLKSAVYILDLFHESPTDQAIKHLKQSYEQFETKPKLSIEFQHYPIKEYRPRGAFAIVGNYNERHRLNAKTDPETRKSLSDIDVQVMSVGYEHTNECCVHNDGTQDHLKPLWMCFGSGTGEGGYGSSNMDRRLRLFRLNTETMEITSWKRRQGQPTAVFDYQFIYQPSKS